MAAVNMPTVTGGHSTMCQYLARQKRAEAEEARSTAAAYALGEDGRGTNLQRSRHLDMEADGLEEIAAYIDAHINDAHPDADRIDWIEAHGLPDPKVYDGCSLRQAVDSEIANKNTEQHRQHGDSR